MIYIQRLLNDDSVDHYCHAGARMGAVWRPRGSAHKRRVACCSSSALGRLGRAGPRVELVAACVAARIASAASLSRKEGAPGAQARFDWLVQVGAR